MELTERFHRLTVGISLLDVPQVPMGSESISKLISYYKQFSFYQNFGSGPFDYICGLSLRYASWTSPLGVSAECLYIHALWLSLIWVVDSVFDKWKYKDKASLIQIINGEILQTEDPFLKMVQTTYGHYLDLIEVYRRKSPYAYEQLVYWTTEYLKNLGNGPGNDFEQWRLIDGAMMCVVWHLILFTEEEIDPIYFQFFEKVSILVSYHNDLLSFQRDVVQETPNLVRLFTEEGYWIAFKKGVEYVDRLYKELANDFSSIDPAKQDQISKIALPILEGSYNWSNTEARYKVGLQMIKALKSGDEDRFHQLLWIKDQTAGDPK